MMLLSAFTDYPVGTEESFPLWLTILSYTCTALVIVLMTWWIVWYAKRPLPQRHRHQYHYQSYAYKAEFARIRPIVLKQYGHRCAWCGRTDDLDVHHLVPRSKGGTNDPSNLVPLCKYHHKMIHKN